MDIVFIIALLATSVIALTFIIERGLALRWTKVIHPAVVRAVQAYTDPSAMQQLVRTCDYYPSTLSRLLRFAADHAEWPKHETVEVLQTRARHEVTHLERGLVVLEIIVGIAPLLGLVGTIYGLIILFANMGQPSPEQQAQFAKGISLALYATLLGLCIAIPTLVAWSYYSRKVETLSVEMESLCDEFLRKHYHQAEAEPAGAAPQLEPQVIEPPSAPTEPPPPSGPDIIAARRVRRQSSR
jgi:biopolymer transport protein ExbB